MAWQFNHSEVMEFIRSQQGYLENCEKLFDIYNRNLTPYLEERIDRDMQSVNSRMECKSRLAPINILPKIVNKLSSVYSINPDRDMTGMDKNLFDEMLKATNFDSDMRQANRYLNLFRIVAIEPVAGIDLDGNPMLNTVSMLRVYPAHKFLLMDDGTIDKRVVCFIKIIGTACKTTLDERGLPVNRNVVVYEAYTRTQFIRFDSEGIMQTTIQIPQLDGSIATDEVDDIRVNEFGEIPVVWMTRDVVTTMPPADYDTYSMVTLLPLLFSDMNYALKYKCFSVMYTIGLSAPKGAMAPNSILKFDKDSAVIGDNQGELNQISPTVAVSEMLEAIGAQYSMWLESRGIKMSSIGSGSTQTSNASGIAKAIDQGEVIEDVVYQRDLVMNMEEKLFSLIGKFLGNNLRVITSFSETSLLPETNTEKDNRIIEKLKNKLISWSQAIKQTNPELTAVQLQEMIAEIKLHEMEEKEESNGMGTRDNSEDKDGSDAS